MAETILIIDDDIDFLPQIEDILSEQGYHIMTSNSGYNGIRMAKTYQPDLIILDINMPILDGFRALEHIRKTQETAQTPVLLLTGSELKDVQKFISTDKGVYYLKKPIQPDSLYAAVRNTLKTSKKVA